MISGRLPVESNSNCRFTGRPPEDGQSENRAKSPFNQTIKPKSMSHQIKEEAREIIQDHVLYSMGAGLIPLFLIDIAAITAVQMEMIKQLCQTYDVDFHETRGKAIVTALTGTTLGRLAGYGIGSALKVIPGLGTFLGGVTLSVTAGATTFAVGQVFANHFEHGGSIFDLDPEDFKRFYRDQLERGKDLARHWKEEKEEKEEKEGGEEKEPPPSGKPPRPSKTKSPFLEELRAAEELKNSGALTEEEFSKIKEEILRRFMEQSRKG